MYTAVAEANNRVNAIFWLWCGEAVLERVWALHPTLGVPKGSVCVHGTNSTFEVRQGLGEAVLLTKLTTGCLRTTDGGNDDAPAYFSDF